MVFFARIARKNTLWPDINRRVCRGQFLWAEASANCFCGILRAKRIGFYSRLPSRELCETIWQKGA